MQYGTLGWILEQKEEVNGKLVNSEWSESSKL